MVFCSAAHADTETINWYMDNNIYATTTCESGGDITLPTAPTKYGYTFQGWSSYVPIEYLESTGTQWIDTGYKIQTANVKIRLKFMKTNTHPGSLIGASNIVSDSNWFVLYFNNNQNYWAIGNGNKETRNYIPELNIIHDVQIETFSNNTYKSIFDGVISSGTWGGSFIVNTMGNVYLYTMSYSPSGSTWLISGAKIYNAEIWNDNVLVRDFIPVLDGSGVPCMYDRVEDKFYYNAGTGDFIAGPVIGE